MTTRLRKEVSREIDGLIVTLTAGGVQTREKGRRTAYGPVGYWRIHTIGAKDLADGRIAEKQKKRKKRRASLRVGL